jgi:hypothetical protein
MNYQLSPTIITKFDTNAKFFTLWVDPVKLLKQRILRY